MVETKAIIGVLRGVESSLMEKLSDAAGGLYNCEALSDEVNIYQAALTNVQSAISRLLWIGIKISW